MDELYFDGACPGGYISWGWVLVRNGEVVDAQHGTSRKGTTNEAEYLALIKALESNPQRPLIVYGDSQLVIRQVTGRYQVKVAHLRPLYNRAKSLLNGAEIQWVPGCDNLADSVSRLKS